MTWVEQAKRLVSRNGEKANGNAYMGLIALSGVVGWGLTVFVVRLWPRLNDHPMPMGRIEQGTQAQAALFEWFGFLRGDLAGPHLIWPFLAAWGLVWLARVVWGYARVERGSVSNLPNLVWLVLVVPAFALNAMGEYFLKAYLIWMPWLVVFAVGYLTNAYLVERGGVYWAAGLASLGLLIVGVYAKLTLSLPLGGALTGPAVPQIGGEILYPFPYTYTVLGLLHVVPMSVDAIRGGRQLTDAGVSTLKAQSMETDTEEVGGVVSSD